MPIDEPDTDDAGRPEIVRTERNIPFLGLTNHSAASLPDDVFGHGSSIRWWAEDRWHENGDGWVGDGNELPDDLNGFQIEARDLPRAQTAKAAWIHPETGEVIETGKHNAVINPEVAEQITRVSDEEGGFEFQGDEPVATVEDARERWGDGWREHIVGDDALYQIPTSDYTVVNPMEFLEPLAREVRDRDLQDDVFGEFRLFRSGGKVSADVLFNGEHVNVPGRDEDNAPIVVGFQVDWDHFGGTSISAQGMAMNWECTNAFRAITDEVTVKHTGDMDERAFTVGETTCSGWREVWQELFALIDQKKDQLAEIIEAAMDMTLEDVMDLPGDFGEQYRNKDDVKHPRLFAVYKMAGYPDYLAKRAAQDAFANAEDPSDPSWWDLHSGATWAVSHFSRADAHSGSQVEEQMRLAKDILYNPPVVADEIEQNWREAQADEGLSSEGGGEAELVRQQDVDEARDLFEERAELMQTLRQDAIET